MNDLVERARAALEGISPGPWFYNGYSLVACQETGGCYYKWEGELIDAGHSVDKTACEVCDNTIRCDHWREAYDREPIVAHVPAFAGDSAHGRHGRDASFIAAAPELVAELADEVERLQRWKDEAVEVIMGLQDLGIAPGERITGPGAAEKAQALRAEVEQFRGEEKL